jgi:hypothetical protein
MLHNESVNVWSHILGVLLFLVLLLWTTLCLSPISNYLQMARSMATSEIQTQAQVVWSTGEQTYSDFEDLCDKYLNITLSGAEMTEAEAYVVWSKALQQYESY